MAQLKRVMISSTARDLPEHRDKVMHACMRLGMFYPDMMENLTATDANALEVSLRMVDSADIYVGVFAFRYGYVPDGETVSVTEAEYDRAVERNISRLIFLMSDEHPVKPSDVETGEGAEKLKKLKERLKKERVVGFFSSADDLLAQVIQALVPHREPDLTAFHYVSEIPEPPEAFIAHPYTLLQTHRLVGRQEELNLLTDWVTKNEEPIYQARILNIVAIGGMGKSALTWKWFNEIAPQEMKPLAGRMWWSFYESDASFENFVTRSLAYVTRRPLAEVEQIPASDREAQLLLALDREPFLIVLDGLERLLIAYARMDAGRLDDSQVSGQRNLRKTADPRAGRFLQRLAHVENSRILVSSRLYPAELATDGGDPIPQSFRRDVAGLTDEDAVELWRAFGLTGSRVSLMLVFAAFGKHPLLIQVLAGEVKRYHRAPGDFETWRKNNTGFDPSKFTGLKDAMGHVLEAALTGLDDTATKILQTIALFRMPAGYDTLASLFIGDGKLCATEDELDEALTELEDRGVVGWDKRANRYDLHPIVRGVVRRGLADDTRRSVYTNLHAHFEALPKIDNWQKVSLIEDLTPAIELYNTLIGLERYDDAYTVFRDRLEKATLYRLSASRQRVDLLEMLFRDGLDQLPRLRDPGAQAVTLNALSAAYHFSGQPGRAAPLLLRVNALCSEAERYKDLSIGLGNLSHALRLSGALWNAEAATNRALGVTRTRQDHFEAVNLSWLGLTLAARGIAVQSATALQRSLRMFVAQSNSQYEGVVSSFLMQRSLWFGAFADARAFANRAWELAHYRNYERDFIRAARAQGASALGLRDLDASDELLHHAITRARQVNFVEEELPALVALAELRRQEGKPDEARELLDDVWDSAERGPYPLFHADAFNVLAQIERDAGNFDNATEAATKAYRLAWCDGPPFAYHWGLVAAQKHLKELGAPEPEMPPFDESKFEPMPEVEIDPDDEFHAGKSGDNDERLD